MKIKISSPTVQKFAMSTQTSARDMSVFCRQLSVVIASDLTVTDALDFVARQTANRRLAAALTRSREKLETRLTLAEAVRGERAFDAYFTRMTAVGERTGTLEEVFASLADYYDREARARRDIRNAAVYPAVLAVMMAAIVLLLVVKILPMFQETLLRLGGDIPGVTKAILSAGRGIERALPFIGAAAVIVAALIAAARFAGAEFWGGLKLALPFSGRIERAAITARMARALSLLLRAGVDIKTALADAAPVIGNAKAERKYLNAVGAGGADIAEALAKPGIFAELFVRMTVIGLAAGRLPEMLSRAAELFDEDVKDSVSRFTQWIEPILVVALSVVVGIILLAVMLPIISVMNNIG
ncbi:MAG: type II secretion system F family protein [Clostridiales bacterium]|jgi:type IV pilus assembly protein PilC|nr:type II secretion system F family protein [Clostridiales bacterium]